MNGTAGVLGVGARLGMDVWIGAVRPHPGPTGHIAWIVAGGLFRRRAFGRS